MVPLAREIVVVAVVVAAVAARGPTRMELAREKGTANVNLMMRERQV
jgi:hypothetical protein